eukprot:4896724-Pyramimonas_sp.AAC.1
MLTRKGLLVRQDHPRSSSHVTMASRWRLSRQCWRNDTHNFINGLLSCRPCSAGVAKPASVEQKAGGLEETR